MAGQAKRLGFRLPLKELPSAINSQRAPHGIAARAPVAPASGRDDATQAAAGPSRSERTVFRVIYTKRNPQKKRKNKQYQDGILEVVESDDGSKICTLFDQEGRAVMSRARLPKAAAAIGDGTELELGAWELEVDCALPLDELTSGRCFIKGAEPPAPPSAGLSARAQRQGAFVPPSVSGSLGPGRPLARGALQGRGSAVAAAPHTQPRPDSIWLNKACPDQHPVVVDPHVGRRLRPHQVEGVQFLYDSVMGAKDPSLRGALLADEMGLGKTLQVIALTWTLLRQGPSGRPSIGKVLVVCPSSLTENWADEYRKWLGDERLKTVVLTGGAEAAQKVQMFLASPQYPVCICSYEAVRKHAPAMAGKCHLLICDEGHRLKSASGKKTISALQSLQAPRRVLLTGTPVQNNLAELYAMVDFVLPGLLGIPAAFGRVFGQPIARARDREATQEERDLGQEREAELNSRLQAFILRRKQSMISKYLPPLQTFVVFIRPTPLQVSLYKNVLRSSKLVDALQGRSGTCDAAEALTLLNALRKLCNHPALLGQASDRDGGAGTSVAGADLDGGAKFHALRIILEAVKSSQDETDKIVVCSNSTAVLDMVETLCGTCGLTTCRIDGKTAVAGRQETVRSFNRVNVSRVCLLSTQAGGVGLNLVGANRLVLFDSHWNPAIDLQAMARVWRAGQTKPCVVYRFLLTGCLDERIYMRQLRKGELATVAEGRAGAKAGAARSGTGSQRRQFTEDELRELFVLETQTACATRDVLAQAAEGTQLGHDWEDVTASVTDGPLSAVIQAGLTTFVREVAHESSGMEATSDEAEATDAADVDSEPDGAEGAEPAPMGDEVDELAIDDVE